MNLPGKYSTEWGNQAGKDQCSLSHIEHTYEF